MDVWVGREGCTRPPPPPNCEGSRDVRRCVWIHVDTMQPWKKTSKGRPTTIVCCVPWRGKPGASQVETEMQDEDKVPHRKEKDKQKQWRRGSVPKSRPTSCGY